MFRQWRQLQTRDFADKGAACPPPGGRSPASLARLPILRVLCSGTSWNHHGWSLPPAVGAVMGQ